MVTTAQIDPQSAEAQRAEVEAKLLNALIRETAKMAGGAQPATPRKSEGGPTAAQIEANQRNAQNPVRRSSESGGGSTGPRTEQGKAASSQNAIKHGLSSIQPVIRSEDDRARFESMTMALHSEIRPNGPIELEMFKHLIYAAWNIDRCHRLEFELSGVSEIDPLFDDNLAKTLTRIESYRVRAERTFHKAIKELKANRPSKKFAEPPAKTNPQNEPKYFSVSPRTYTHQTPKVGRNEPCPCQSGKKYKHCCLNGTSMGAQISRAA